MSRERKQKIILLKKIRRGCGWVTSARWTKRVSSACPSSESSIHTWKYLLGAQGVHPSEGSQPPRSTDVRAGSWRGQKGWPITYSTCILRRPSWCLPVGRRVKRLPGPGHPQELCCGAGPCTPCLQGSPALRGPAKARPHPPHGPQPHSDSGARPPQHGAATRGQTRTGEVRSWSKGVKRRLCGQSKICSSSCCWRPATEMVTGLTIPQLICASHHHAGHLQYTCLLKNNIRQNKHVFKLKGIFLKT